MYWVIAVTKFAIAVQVLLFGGYTRDLTGLADQVREAETRR